MSDKWGVFDTKDNLWLGNENGNRLLSKTGAL
jgi:hypothetical protein